MAGGDSIRVGLQRGVEQCRGMLIIGSQDAVDSNWVEDEISIAQVERNDSRDFRVIPLRLDNADVGTLVKGQSWIDIDTSDFGAQKIFEILRSLYPGDKLPDPSTSRDVYASLSWDENEDESGEQSGRVVCEKLIESGFRLVGDAKDQPSFDLNRIRDIVSSCGAFVSVIPFRNNISDASSSEQPYKYFLSEIDLAESLGLPVIVIADQRIRRTNGDDSNWLRMRTDANKTPPEVDRAISQLWNSWRKPSKPHYVFMALDLDSTAAVRASPVRQLLERVTGMPTVVGTDIKVAPVQDSLMRSISAARLVIADITSLDDKTGSQQVTRSDFNLEVCIEAGIAYYAQCNLKLIAQGDLRSPPFMLRLNQMEPYKDETERVALVHNIALGNRRRIINAEL